MLFYFYKSKLNIMESLSFNLCEKMSNWCYLLLLTTLLFSCEEKEDLFPVEEKLEKVLTKGAYNDGSFEWDRINHIVTQDQYNATVSIPLPWEPGVLRVLAFPLIGSTLKLNHQILANVIIQEKMGGKWFIVIWFY